MVDQKLGLQRNGSLSPPGESHQQTVKRDRPIQSSYRANYSLISTTDTITLSEADRLLPLGAWDGCMMANLASSQDSVRVATLFKRWRPAIVILSVHASLSRNETLALLPLGIPTSYQKKMMTVCHQSVGGVTSTVWCFIHYTRWTGLISYPSIMTSITLPRTLQTALSDTFGLARGATLDARSGIQPPEAIGILSSSTGAGLFLYFLESRSPQTCSASPLRRCTYGSWLIRYFPKPAYFGRLKRVS
jgi:hypothetical protein